MVYFSIPFGALDYNFFMMMSLSEISSSFGFASGNSSGLLFLNPENLFSCYESVVLTTNWGFFTLFFSGSDLT